MEAMRADSMFGGGVEHPIDEYVRLCREVTMLEARAAQVLADIERVGLHEYAGYLTVAAMVKDRLGASRQAHGFADYPRRE